MSTNLTAPPLTFEQIERFRQDGYLGPFSLGESRIWLDRVRERVAGEVLSTVSAWSGNAMQGRHLDHPAVYELCAHPAIIERAARIFGPDLLLWQSNLFVKNPGDREYPWHQDTNYWSFMEPQLNLSAWVALDDANEENGCVRVIPGSHKRLVPHIPTSDPRYDVRFGDQMADPAAFDASKQVSCPLRPGEFFLFNEKTLHSSASNRSPYRRMGITVRLTVPLVKIYGKTPCILVRGRDRLGFNRLVPPPTERKIKAGLIRAARWLPAPLAQRLDLVSPGQAFRGNIRRSSDFQALIDERELELMVLRKTAHERSAVIDALSRAIAERREVLRRHGHEPVPEGNDMRDEDGDVATGFNPENPALDERLERFRTPRDSWLDIFRRSPEENLELARVIADEVGRVQAGCYEQLRLIERLNIRSTHLLEAMRTK